MLQFRFCSPVSLLLLLAYTGFQKKKKCLTPKKTSEFVFFFKHFYCPTSSCIYLQQFFNSPLTNFQNQTLLFFLVFPSSFPRFGFDRKDNFRIPTVLFVSENINVRFPSPLGSKIRLKCPLQSLPKLQSLGISWQQRCSWILKNLKRSSYP